MTSSTDRIEKKTLLRAPRSRVWRAIADAREFGAWFGVSLEGSFTPGAHVRGKLTNKAYEHITMEIWVEKVEAERLFSYRWHPFAIDPKVDYSSEKTTLVEFSLADADGGTLLTITESGFDAVPAARRAKAFEMNSGGWAAQITQIEKFLADAK
ncbi:MAG: SRPBCC family protein [Polyangiaceae bacterium]